MSILKNKTFWFTVILSLIFISLIGVFGYNNRVWIKKNFLITLYGQDQFIESMVEKVSDETKLDEPSLIQTSVLPIGFTKQKINGYVKGVGSLAKYKNNVFISDRLGNIFCKSEEIINAFNLNLNNSLESYVSDSSQGFDTDAMRIHSVVISDKTNKIYVSYTRFLGNEKNAMVISQSEGIFDECNSAKLTKKWTDIYISDHFPSSWKSHAGGGRLILSEDENNLYFSVGYGDANLKSEKFPIASLLDQNSFGKIYKYNLLENSFTVLSKGHRNVQGLAEFENIVYSSEHHHQGGDEINKIVSGGNYGYPIQTYGTDYEKYSWSYEDKKFEGIDEKIFIEPLYSFVPSVAPSSMAFVKDFNKKWIGDLLLTTLKAQSVYRLKIKESRVIFSEPIWVGERIRDILNHNNKILILGESGSLITWFVDEQLLQIGDKSIGYLAQPILKKCAQCHRIGDMSSTYAPSLKGILGRKVGSSNYEHYSDWFLENTHIIWDEENLTAYLSNSQKFALGTTMPNQNLTKKEISSIVKLLKDLN